MTDEKRRVLDVWLGLHLFNQRVKWSGGTFYFFDDSHFGDELPHYTTTDWQLVVEAMRKRGWMLIVKWVPDNVSNYGTPAPHKMVPRVICEMIWFGHHQKPPQSAEVFTLLDQIASAQTEGKAVCLAAKAALGQEAMG